MSACHCGLYNTAANEPLHRSLNHDLRGLGSPTPRQTLDKDTNMTRRTVSMFHQTHEQFKTQINKASDTMVMEKYAISVTTINRAMNDKYGSM
jgi:hypothetical protein